MKLIARLCDRAAKGLIVFVATTLLVVVVTPITVAALPAPQAPATEAIITLEADGIAPFDTTTFDPATSADSGTDGDGSNGVVRNHDLVTYNVEVSLNDQDDTNLVATVTLNDKATWTALPGECKTVAGGFAVIPDSSMTDTSGDGLLDTLVCNLGDHNEGTKLIFKPVAAAAAGNADVLSASVLSSSDNNVNTSGLPGTQGDGPIDTTVTSGFGINITKYACGFPERSESPNEGDCNPLYFDDDALVAGSPEVKIVPWHITLGYDIGSEFVADNGTGTQDFTITDTWVGTHSIDTSVDSDNAAGDFDDGIVMQGTLSGVPTDSCALVDPSPGATVVCTQAGPGEPITIQLNGVAVSQQPLAEVVLNMALPYPTIFDPITGGESYSVNNTATLTAWGGTGALVTSGTGAVDPGPETAVEDYVINADRPGSVAFYKTFHRNGTAKTGTRAASPGEIVETSIQIADTRNGDTSPGICDTIDTSVFEFAGNLDVGQRDGIWHGRPVSIGGANAGEPNTYHHLYNPVLSVAQASDWLGSAIHLDPLSYGATVEYTDVDYTVTGDDHWTAICVDDLDGDGGSDWVTDYNALPGGAASVVRVRLMWDRSEADLRSAHPTFDRAFITFSFDLMVKPSVPVGSWLPNTAATRDLAAPAYWNREDGWLGTSGGTGFPVYESIEDDPSAALFSFNNRNADRVLVVPATMSITKLVEPFDRGPVSSGEIASFKIDPKVTGVGPAGETMTFTDTLPAELSYVGDDCAAVYAAAGLTCSVAVSGQTVTWTVTDYTIGGELPPFILNTEVVAGTESGTYTNRVIITSSWPTLSDTSHCANAVSLSGAVTAASAAACESTFIDAHFAYASVLVVADAGVEVVKTDTESITEPLSDYVATLSYVNLGGLDIGVGHLIDVLPYNGDGVLAPNYSPQRHNFENPGNVNTATQTSDPDGAVDFVSIAPSSAGETFEYSTDDPTTIDHRPCHPDNWPAGADEASNPLIADVCARGLIDPDTDVPTSGTAGTGATVWGPLPADPAEVTAIRASTPAFPVGESSRDLELRMNTAYAVDGDLYCNNFGANTDIITLDIVSNDVCVEVVAGSIGDYVWHDENSDGVQDASEDPILGVDVKLLVEDPSNPGTFIPFQIPDPDNPGQLIDYVVTTDAAGSYLFENLPSGNFQVMVDPATLPVDAQQTYDANGLLDNMSNVTLYGPNNPETPTSTYTDVDDDLDQDFGYVFPEVDVALAKTTTATTAAPGQDVTFTIEVYNQGGVELAFVNVADYIPSGFTMSPADSNGWTIDGTAPTVGGETGTVYTTVAGPLAAGASTTVDIVLTVDADAVAGDLVNVAEITGLEDTEGRDRTDDDVDSSADNDPDNDSGGTPGSEEDNHIDDDGVDSDGDGITDEDDSDPATVNIVTPNNSLGDYVWFDSNGDGIQGDDEAPAEGIIVNLYDDQGNLIATTTTDVDGFYQFTGLPDGVYQVEFVAPAGYGFTDADQGSDDGADSDANPFGRSPLIDLDSAGESDEGINDPTVDAGLVHQQGLGGVVWFDTNGDGIQDADEVVVPGVLVELLDVDGNPVLDETGNPITTVTAADGSYFFPTAPGDYTIRFSPGEEATFSTGTGADNDLIDFLNGLTGVYTVNIGEIVPGIDAPLIESNLAFTGANSTYLYLFGAVLTMAGFGVTTTVRRRRNVL